ncbi:MAG: FecR family protein [Micavibrio sp.]|nr:FecR family protein [Micavibrio sp.]
MTRILVFFQVTVLCCLLAVPAQADEDGVIGNIVEIEGTATQTVGANTLPAKINAPVHMNDVLKTGAQSRLFILLIDNTEWTLSENANFRVTEYVFDPADNTHNKGRYSVLSGAFRYVSGLVAKKPNPDVQITTPIGSIGIRGTDFWGGMMDGSYGVQVDEGRVEVATDGGRVLVNAGQGTSIRNRKFAPAAPARWSRDRLQRSHASVRLENQTAVRQRMAALQSHQPEMRQRYKTYLQSRNGKIIAPNGAGKIIAPNSAGKTGAATPASRLKENRQLLNRTPTTPRRQKQDRQQDTPAVQGDRRENLREERLEKLKERRRGLLQ